jgi:hypothetical protein
MIAQHILPALGRMKVADLRRGDIDQLHRKISRTGAKVRANRVVALLSRMFSLAVMWEMRTDNPVKGIERQPRDGHATVTSGATSSSGCSPRWPHIPTARGRTSSSCCC